MKMSEYIIEITVEVKSNIPFRMVKEWACYVTGYQASLSSSNPLGFKDLNATQCTVREKR
jgi:hypothetical protein